MPDIDDDKGLSLLIANTEKGMIEFNKVDAFKKEMNFEKAIAYNSSMFKSVDVPKNRNKFMKEVHEKSFERLAIKYTKLSLIMRVKRLFKRIINKLKRDIKKSVKS